MKKNANNSRRMFLRGMGGALLTIPFLSSLETKESSAAPTGKPKRFIALRAIS